VRSVRRPSRADCEKDWGANVLVEMGGAVDLRIGMATCLGQSLTTIRRMQITDDFGLWEFLSQAGIAYTGQGRVGTPRTAFSRLRLCGSDRSNKKHSSNVFPLFSTLEGPPANGRFFWGVGSIGVMASLLLLAIAFQIHQSHQARSTQGSKGPDTSNNQHEQPSETTVRFGQRLCLIGHSLPTGNQGHGNQVGLSPAS